jgi:hypothetical protein
MSLAFGQTIELTVLTCCNFPVSLLVARSNDGKLYARCTRCYTIYPAERLAGEGGPRLGEAEAEHASVSETHSLVGGRGGR